MSSDIILSVKKLQINTSSAKDAHAIVDDISFDVKKGQVTGIVGESGSGKSITMLALMGLLSADGASIVTGDITLEEKLLYSADFGMYMPLIRGVKMSMIFQEPMTSLNPVLTVGSQIASIIEIANTIKGKENIHKRVIELLRLVGISDPERRFKQYPHEYSGGMRQRAMIAMAIANEPRLLIADEPTTALDVTVQAQIMRVLQDVREKTGTAMILVTHDLGLIAENAHDVIVMYGGQIIEHADVSILFDKPLHPYTVSLLRSIPNVDLKTERLYSIPGQPPTVEDRPKGCVFQSRCELSRDRERCIKERPILKYFTREHSVACHYFDEVDEWIKLIDGQTFGEQR